MGSNGNTYFIDAESATELARLETQEALLNDVFDMFPHQFVRCPFASVLDLACGPGGWLLQVAGTEPSYSTVGVDISERMIQYARAKAEIQELSTQFRIMDILKVPWDFPDGSFDLVNIRMATGFVPAVRWSALFEEVWRVLKPGGVFRHIEAVYMSAPNSSAIHRLGMLIHKAMYQGGLCFSEYEMATEAVLARQLRRQGFEKIVLTPYVADLSFGMPLHLPMFENFCTSSRLLKPFLIKKLRITSEEIDALLDTQEREFQEESFVAHWYFGSVSGFKPQTPSI